VEIYRHDWAYDSSRAERELGYHGRPFAEGLASTVAWLREKGEIRDSKDSRNAR
jgi:nucleoside-diphosphate-sugar epimerase